MISFSPGIAYQDSGQTQTILLDNGASLSNQYVANNDYTNSLVTQLFIGDDIAKRDNVTWRSGVSFSYTDNLAQNGTVNQFALPQFNNLSYRYNVQAFSVLAKLQALLTKNQTWQPYVDAGVGYANTRTYDYQESPLITGAVPMEPFAGKGENNFAYSVGAGLMVNITKVFSIGLGYEFADMGGANLGVSPAQDTTQTINLNHIYLQQLLLHFTLTV